jgi:hypothetical protein
MKETPADVAANRIHPGSAPGRVKTKEQADGNGDRYGHPGRLPVSGITAHVQVEDISPFFVQARER